MMNDECEPLVQKKFNFVRGAILQNMLKKSKEMRPHYVKCKKCAPLRQMPKNAAHAEKLKKCWIFMRRTIVFFPRVYFMRIII